MNVLFLLSISMIRNGSLIVVANHSIQIDQTYYPPGVIMITIVVIAILGATVVSAVAFCELSLKKAHVIFVVAACACMLSLLLLWLLCG